ncbi:MAG: isoprenylcysteine carboxylmethyltransferase family protein [Gammaproteobacteria bacterium]|nr:isoprenylcysteine carboxylmethyltransferase family protein [Gammaproteobacteria bacterium]
MIEIWAIILIHQILFQGMFLVKNYSLSRKIGVKIRGHNIEATVSVLFFALFIVVAFAISLFEQPFGKIQLLDDLNATVLGCALLTLNLVISAASLINMRESWRVGVLEEQKTQLVTSGIYRFTRNPYFVSYFLMFAAYTLLTQNLILMMLTSIGILLTHIMIIKEERYLYGVHGKAYIEYKGEVPRYLFI